MTLNNGRFDPDTKEAILDAMVADAKAKWDDDINAESLTVLRDIYEPVAERLAIAQRDIGLILDAAQVEHAEGRALDLLTALIGVTRNPAEPAEGEVKFYRSSAATTDYIIPKGTTVQTDSSDPLQFETTEQATLHEGESSVLVPVKSKEGGSTYNLGASTLTVLPDPPVGIEAATNPEPTIGGADRESDEELRERAQEQLANGASATAPALVSNVKAVDGVTNVSILINDTDEDNGRGYGLPAHSFEMIVTHDGLDSTLQEVAQVIMDSKAVGDYSVYGENGQPLDDSKEFVVGGEIETELPNGQTHPVGFSQSVKKDIFVDVSLEYDPEEYPGDAEVKNAIVDYIGGYTTSGFEQDGELGTSEDVLYGEIEYAIRGLSGVYDVTDLKVGTSDNPTGTSNISVGTYEQAITDARNDTQINVSSTEVNI